MSSTAVRNGATIVVTIRLSTIPDRLEVDFSAIDSTGGIVSTFGGDLAAGYTLQHTIASSSTQLDGAHYLSIHAHRGTYTLDTTARVLLDNTAPDLVVIEPADFSAAYAAPITIRGTVTDATSGVAEFSANGSCAVPDCVLVDDAWTVTQTPASGGLATVTLSASDVAGNSASLQWHILLEPPTDAAEVYSEGFTRLYTLAGGEAFAFGWGELGNPSDSLPDGRLDLLAGGNGFAQVSHSYCNVASDFVNADFALCSTDLNLSVPATSFSVSPWTAAGRVEAIAVAYNSGPDSVFLWSETTGAYVNIASDAIVTEDNSLLAGDANDETYLLAWLDYDLDGDQDLYRLTSSDDPLYRDNLLMTNTGSVSGIWRFAQVGSGDAAAAVDGDRGRSVAIADFDFDGRDDIYVASSASVLYLNRTTVADTPDFVRYQVAGVDFDFQDGLGSSMEQAGPAAVDIDSDGDLDLVTTADGLNPCNLFVNELVEVGAFALTKATPATLELRSHAFKNAVSAGDYDNDGDLDLFVAVGAGANRLLRNDLIGDDGLISNQPLSFTDISPASITLAADATYGATWVDHDADGDLDIFVSNWSGAFGLVPGLNVARSLYRDNGGNRFYYRVRVARQGHINPLGTKVMVDNGDYRQVQEIMPMVGFNNAPAPDLYFGCGARPEVDVHVFPPGRPLSAGPALSFTNKACSNTSGFLDEIELAE